MGQQLALLQLNDLFPNRYSHTAHLVEDKIVLIGGVNTHHPPPGVAVINLTTQRSMEFALPVSGRPLNSLFYSLCQHAKCFRIFKQ